MGAGTLVQNIRRIVTRFHMGTESGTGRGRLARTTYAEPSPGVLSDTSPKTAAHQKKQQPFPEQLPPSTAMVLTPGDGTGTVSAYHVRGTVTLGPEHCISENSCSSKTAAIPRTALFLYRDGAHPG